MHSLNVEDIIHLPAFKCKICDDRLRVPVFRVTVLGNVCGKCKEKRQFKIIDRNFHIENFLEKLYVPCIYEKNGCTFEGPYDKTRDHEENACRFRERKCPFAYDEDQQCKYEYQHSEDIIDHIQANHKESVIEANGNLVEVTNPTESHLSRIYLLRIDNTYVLLRIMLNTLKKSIYYAFYHFDNLDHIVIASKIFDGIRTVHESTIPYEFLNENARIIPFSTLKKNDFLERIEIEIRVGENEDETAEDVETPEIDKLGVKCKGCSRIFEVIEVCGRCNGTTCQKCGSVRCCGWYTATVDLRKIKPSNEFLCGNAGCNKIIKSDLYNMHDEYHCFKKKFKCRYETCEFEGFLREHMRHVLQMHTLNENVTLTRGKTEVGFFINGDDIFYNAYFLTEKNELEIKTVKLTEPFSTRDYVCIITIKSKSTYHSITVQGEYTYEGYTKKFQLGDTLQTDELIAETLVKRL